MPSYALVKASNDAYSPSYVPVVVVFGGTSGIAKAMTRRLAEQLRGRIRVIVVGRNKASADALFRSLPQLAPEDEDFKRSGYEFIHCDISLMKNVHRAAIGIAERCPKINYLVLASGQAFLGFRRETEEGIETQLALRYYWKFAIINDLLPQLRAAKDGGEAAGVLAVLVDGRVPPMINFDDLDVKKRHWLGIGPLIQGASYGDLMLHMYAERESEIAFTHMYPGMVDTEANRFTLWYLVWLTFLMRPLVWLFFIKVEVSAENMVYGLLNGERGFYQRNTVADSVGVRGVSRSEENRRAFWEHSLEKTRSVPQ